MNTNLFHPSSLNYVKNKSKQLQKAMPGMQLSEAQEATAIALGFDSWFDCTKRCPSDSKTNAIVDEDLDQNALINRRHHQYCSLVSAGNIGPGEASRFVRAWGLTSKSPTTFINKYVHPYTHVIENISAVNNGSLDPLEQGWDSEPEIIGEGVVLGHIGTKNQFFVLDHKTANTLPAFMKGNSACFLSFEPGLALPLFLSAMNASKDEIEKGVKYLNIYEPWHFEWRFNKPSNDRINSMNISLSMLHEAAIKHPNDWFPLSYRSVFPEDSNDDSIKEYIPALKGHDFSEFIETQGKLKIGHVQWFEVPKQESFRIFSPFNKQPHFPLNISELVPCGPIYHSPFKHGPMYKIEYEAGVEGGGLRLDDEIDWDM